MLIPKCLIVISTLLIIACSEEKQPSEFIWYEEAKQDDGSIVVVKKIEARRSSTRMEPGAQNYGYRLPKVELTDPKSGKPITWYPTGLPPLLPYAVHLHDDFPYIFATFYLNTSYIDWGCPIPPYIVFRWEGDKWKRIALSALPRQFKRRNLLPSAAEQVFVDPGWKFIAHGDLVKAHSIEAHVKPLAYGADRGEPLPLYRREIQYEDLGPYDKCNQQKNVPTKYDNVEIK